MTFEPKTEEQLQLESLLPEGTYDFEVATAEEKLSKAQNPMIAVTHKVYHGQHGAFFIIPDWLMSQMGFKLLHFCKAVGLEAEYKAGKLDATTLPGRGGKLQLKQEPAKDGYPAKNVVKDYGPGKDALGTPLVQSRPAQPLNLPVEDDDDSGAPF